MKLIFEEELKKEKNIRILSFLNNINDLSQNEIEQLKLIVLWETIYTFNEDKKCLFSTHLYNKCRFKFLKHINKKKIQIGYNKEPSYRIYENVLNELPLLYKTILYDRYVYKYTIVQLVHRYGLKKKQINILIEDSKNFLKKELEKDYD